MSAISGPAPLGAETARVARSDNGVSAARGGAQLVAASVVSLVANYLFLLGAGRVLGSADYGTLAALAGLLTVVLLPTGAIQMAVSREVSRREALGEDVEAAALVRSLVKVGAVATIPLLLVALALLVPLRELLRIDATAPVALALTALVGIFLFPIALGALQGQQRFRALAFNSAAPMVVRLVVFVALVAGGVRLYGALGAVAVGSVAGTTMALLAVRHLLGSSRSVATPELRPFLRYLVPVAVGLFGIAVLTNADLLVVKARFSADDAGVYAAASAFARVAFFLPATILAVLFPRTAARQARGEQSSDILGRSLIVTAAFCALLTGFYALVGEPLVDLTFGEEFSAAADLLVPFCVAMTCFSLVNVVLAYHLSRGESRFAWIVAASIAVQIAVLATIPGSLRGVLWVDAVVGIGLIVVHELTVGSSGPALAAGYRVFAVGATLRRAAAWLVAHRRLFVETAVVLGGYSLLAAAVTWPLAYHLGSALPGTFPNDGAGGVSWLWQLHQEDGYRLAGTTHHTLTGAPLGWEQGNALNFQWLLAYYPGYLLAGVVGEVAALNLVTLGGLALSGASMYLLVRWLGCRRLVAAWAGVAYLAFPWHLERVMAGHSSLVHIQIFPLLLLAALAWTRRPTDGRALLVALAVTAAWLTSGYYGAIALLALVGVTVAAVVVHRRSLGWLRAVGRAAKLWAMAVLGFGIVGISALLAGGTGGIGVGRDAAELEYFGARLRDYLPDPGNRVLGGLTERVGEPLYPYVPGAENVLYPGLLTVALALIWVVALARRRSNVTGHRNETIVLIAVAAVAIVFAAPDPLRLAGVSLHPMPSYLVYEVLPSFRVPSRLILLTMTALIPLAALGLDLLLTRIGRRVGTSRVGLLVTAGVAAAACVVSVVELAPLPVELARTGAVPAEYNAVARTPSGVLAEYPLSASWNFTNSGYLFWQRTHGRRLLNGAAENTDANAVRRMLVDPGARGTAGSLALLGVTAIVTRSNTLDWGKGETARDSASYGPGYELVERVPGARVWKVIASPAPAVAAYRGVEVDDPRLSGLDGFVPYPLTGSVVHVDIYAKQAGLYRLRFTARAEGGPATLRVTGRAGSVSADVDGERRFAIPVRIPRGHSALTVTVARSSAQIEAEASDIELSGLWWSAAGEGDERRSLVPTVLSSSPGF